jgi:hypothetical protein
MRGANITAVVALRWSVVEGWIFEAIRFWEKSLRVE